MDREQFIQELKKLNISLNLQQLEQLNQYYDLLIDWNKVMNLTGITEKKEVYLKHFYDSLTLIKGIDLNNINNICDVGTGAGFPGMVIKIVFPKIEVTLIDSLNKRINFLNEVINKLQLKGIKTVHARAEEYAINNREKYELVVARAVAPLNILLEYCIPLVKEHFYFIAMKSNVCEELENSKNAFNVLSSKLIKNISFQLPNEHSLRTLLVIEKNKKTNLKYPRKYKDIKKESL